MTESLTMFEGEQAVAFMEVCQERDIFALKLAVALEEKEMATAEAAVLLERAIDTHEAMFALEMSAQAYQLNHEKTLVGRGLYEAVLKAVVNLSAMKERTPLASAHLALHRRLVEGQRTPGTVEVCIGCQKTQPHWRTVCPGWVGADDEVLGVVMPCPIRAEVKP